MAITTAMCNSFKQELLSGIHDLDTDTIKLALIRNSPAGTYDASTTNYNNITVNADEVVGVNYTAGGNTLTNPTISLSGSTAIVDFADEIFSNVTLSSDGCIIYNASKGGRVICVLAFDTTVSISGDFVVTFPVPNASNAVIRIS